MKLLNLVAARSLRLLDSPQSVYGDTMNFLCLG